MGSPVNSENLLPLYKPNKRSRWDIVCPFSITNPGLRPKSTQIFPARIYEGHKDTYCDIWWHTFTLFSWGLDNDKCRRLRVFVRKIKHGTRTTHFMLCYVFICRDTFSFSSLCKHLVIYTGNTLSVSPTIPIHFYVLKIMFYPGTSESFLL